MIDMFIFKMVEYDVAEFNQKIEAGVADVNMLNAELSVNTS